MPARPLPLRPIARSAFLVAFVGLAIAVVGALPNFDAPTNGQDGAPLQLDPFMPAPPFTLPTRRGSISTTSRSTHAQPMAEAPLSGAVDRATTDASPFDRSAMCYGWPSSVDGQPERSTARQFVRPAAAAAACRPPSGTRGADRGGAGRWSRARQRTGRLR